ncbi:acyltransferase [Egibacter rhizosphaerae]|uniref:Acyltransferase n=1 Tax=Egibacter rhizosphaerae TaxID=1670831 RepID=A0A411YER3_9ACTN|nr:acyltransferase [Egibacter rhizosphaerae]QBI19715.1 acyltransferase [Egibacter rhizosphaerae]
MTEPSYPDEAGTTQDPAERLTAARIAELTPLDRNRYADFLRVLAICIVVLGHWLVAVVLIDDGWEAGSLLAMEPWTQWLTWIFQVMPLFFFVGGYANAAAWRSARQRGQPWAQWIRVRARRLLRPVLPLLVLWVPLAAILGTLGVPGDLLQLGTQVAFIPAWFLAAYLLVCAIVPTTWALHERLGAWAVVAFAVAAALVDIVHLFGVPLLGWANFVFVWAGIHQLGYLWYAERLPTRVPAALTLLGAGLAALVALTQLADYPLSLVGTGIEDERSNNSPPTVALTALGVAQVGLVLALRRPAERWLQRPAVWARVVIGGSLAMTVYLWHMTALVLVIALTYPTGLWPAGSEIDATWWAMRPLWWALLAAALAGLVAVFARFERSGKPIPRRGRVRTAVGLAASTAGIGLLVAGGLYDPARTLGVPLSALGLLALGLGALGVLRPRPSREGGE